MMIRNKDRVYLLGQMEENMMEDGSMENNMVMENTTQAKVKLNSESGKMVRESNGLMKKICQEMIEKFCNILI